MPDQERRPSPRWLHAGAIALFVALVIIPLVTVAIASTFLFQPAGRVLEVEMRATGGRWAQVFWSGAYAMNAADSGLVPLHTQPTEFETLRLPLPTDPIETLRFDPLDGAGEVVIRRMRVKDDAGQIVREIDPRIFTPLNQIAAIRPDKDGTRIVTTPNATDAMLVARSSWFSDPPRWNSLTFVTPLSLAWIAAAVVVLVATAVGFIVREIAVGSFTLRDGLWLAALFLVIVAAKLLLVHNYQVPVPFWDQWDGEALTLYIPWPDHAVTWRQMFTLHNEHRIFFSRMLALSLLLLNGQWDPHLQIVVNSILHAFIGVLVASILWLSMGRRCLPVIVLAMALAIAPPFALENSLGGFQSAFYFLLLFSILAFWLMGTRPPGTAAWWLGVFCALCTPFTVAGGILVLAPIGCLIVLRALANLANPRTANGDPRTAWRSLAANVVALAAIAAVGYGALPPSVGAHESLKAGTFFYFRVSLTRNLAFPFINYPRAVVFMWLPLAILGVAILRRKFRTTAIEQVALALAAWVVVQGAAMAYSRGAGGLAPASRYLDLLALGMVANVMAFLAAFAADATWRRRAMIAGALAVWLGVTSIGIYRVSRDILESGARVRAQWTQEHIKNVRHFVMTDDFDSFVSKRGPQDVPYHNPSMLATWLDHPFIRRILPASVRQPLNLGTAPSATSTTDLQPFFDSYALGRFKGVGSFNSQPIACQRFRHLQFEVFSSESWSGLELALREESGRETQIRMPWDRLAGWNSVTAACPDGRFAIIANDSSQTAWLAVRPPAEIAWASTIAASLIQQAKIIGLAALATTGLALALTLRRSYGRTGLTARAR
jgi:hypothetical protein